LQTTVLEGRGRCLHRLTRMDPWPSESWVRQEVVSVLESPTACWHPFRLADREGDGIPVSSAGQAGSNNPLPRRERAGVGTPGPCTGPGSAPDGLRVPHGLPDFPRRGKGSCLPRWGRAGVGAVGSGTMWGSAPDARLFPRSLTRALTRGERVSKDAPAGRIDPSARLQAPSRGEGDSGTSVRGGLSSGRGADGTPVRGESPF